MNFKTSQEEFWAGNFGTKYIERNSEPISVANNIALFAKLFYKMDSVEQVIEFGANIGLNLVAIKQLLPNAELSAVEINKEAAKKLKELDFVKLYNMSILDFEVDYPRNLVFTKGVLIHITPEYLDKVYGLLHQASNKYICLIEYYNPTPIELPYRGHRNMLFKRDFAGEMLDKFEDLKLVDYGFVYHRDTSFPHDDANYFILEKKT